MTLSLKMIAQQVTMKKLLAPQYYFISSRFFSSSPINLGAEIQKPKPFESIPKLSQFGLIASFLPGGQFYKKELQDLHQTIREKYGNIFKFPALLGQPSMVFAYDAEDFEKVFRNDGIWPGRLPLQSLDYYRKNSRPDIYSEYIGLISSQGKEWHDMRTIINPILMQPKTTKFYCSRVDEIAKEFVELMKTLRDANGEMPADFQNHINTWSLESVAAVALERRLHVLGGVSKDEKAQELIKGIRIFFEKNFVYDGLPSIWRYYQTKGFKEFLENYDRITNIIIHYIEDAIKEFEKNEARDEEHEESILRKLVKVNKKAAVVMVSDMLLAGVDTTAVSVTNILYLLAKNPEKQQKLREEILKMLPEKNSKLTPENMKNLPYLRSVIKETFRIRPVTFGTARQLNTKTVLAGYEIPPGTHVMMPAHMEMVNPKHFPQPDKFIPERWLRDNTDPSCPHVKTANPFAFLPFGFGARMCVGKRIADLEMEVLIANVVRNYKIEWNHPDLKFKSLFVNIPISDLKFKITDL